MAVEGVRPHALHPEGEPVGQQKAKRCFTRNREQLFIFGPTPPTNLPHICHTDLVNVIS